MELSSATGLSFCSASVVEPVTWFTAAMTSAALVLGVSTSVNTAACAAVDAASAAAVGAATTAAAVYAALGTIMCTGASWSMFYKESSGGGYSGQSPYMSASKECPESYRNVIDKYDVCW